VFILGGLRLTDPPWVTIQGFFILMNRVGFLIDGFNLYHSVVRFHKDTHICTKWLDIYSLCKSYISLFGRDAELASVYYFSALPHYLSVTNPDKIDRHQKYLSCLRDSGIIVELGRFKEKDVLCKKCGGTFLKHEEKETDVAIGVTLSRLLFKDECEIAVIMSGDTDLSAAVKRLQPMFLTKKILFAFPYARKNKELSMLALGSFSIGKKQYIRYQFPNPVTLKDGTIINKPSTW